MNKTNILLVEDNPIAQYVARSLLSIVNCEVKLAETAKQARELVDTQCFSLIFMDIGLPDGHGAEISQSIRARPDCPNYRTPIVAITAHCGSDIEKQKWIKMGINSVFEKPLTLEKVNLAIQYID